MKKILITVVLDDFLFKCAVVFKNVLIRALTKRNLNHLLY